MGVAASMETLKQWLLAALGRKPTLDEFSQLENFLQSEQSIGAGQVDARADMIHVVMNMKEFIFIH